MDIRFTYYPDPLLRQKAQPIAMSGVRSSVSGARDTGPCTQDIAEPSPEILDLLAQMKEICIVRKGIGLAAHQVGLVLPVIVYGVPAAPDKYELVGVVNPKIMGNGSELAIREEGCLSFPKLYLEIQRPRRLAVEGWFDDTRKFEKRELFDMSARIFSHECDHTNGILFIDRVDAETRQRIKPELQRIAEEKREENAKEIRTKKL